MGAAEDLAARYAALVAEGAIENDPAQAGAVEALDGLVRGLRDFRRPGLLPLRRKPPKGLYIWGGVGRGKTMLMDMAHEAMGAAGIGSRRFHFHEFMVRVHDRVHEPELSESDDPALLVAGSIADGADVLCFDEMEVRDIADAMIVARVMEGFMDGGGVLVATSNRRPDDLYEGGLHRERFLPFIGLVKERMAVHELASPNDWRLRQLAGLRHWFTGPDAETGPMMAAAWERLTRGIEERPDSVTVAGRTIAMPRVAGSMAFAGFDDLCAKAYAARDYLAVADRYAGLFLAGIPAMDDTMRNEARRLMWLVDGLYDRGRFLVASSPAAMGDIYRGRQWQAEFPRTLSRLNEMTRGAGGRD